MRDPVLDEALRRLAAEAATRFSSLIACGEEVPFDVAEGEGDSSLFYRYVPLTHKFVAAHESDLRSLPSYGPACGAINLSGAAVAYLENRGIAVPADPDQRAGLMISTFISELWQGCAEFTLDSKRLDQLLASIEAETRDVHEADLLVVPVVGLQMPTAKLELTGTVRVVRADSIDAPLEAMSSEGMGRKPWEPQYLALVDQGSGSEAVAEALGQLSDAITVMRLFKSGGIGLGPFAFAPVADGHWSRVATGVAPVRSGGYVLDEDECAELTELCERVAPRLVEIRDGGRLSASPAAWALRRFEMGRERQDHFEAITDHLMALRAVLEGDGPVGAPLPVRAAALIAPAAEREQAREKLEAALRMERALISGARPEDAGAHALAGWFEDSVRQIIRDDIEGALGDDAVVAADESLLAAGLQEGEGSISQRGDTEEWDAIPEPIDTGDAEPAGWRPFELPTWRSGNDSEPSDSGAEAIDSDDMDPESVRRSGDDAREEITRIMEPIPNFESEIRIADLRERDGDDDAALFDHEIDVDAGFKSAGDVDEFEYEDTRHSDWLSEVEGDEFGTIEWPAGAIRAYRASDGEYESPEVGAIARERVDSPRVRHLFPVVEDADWSVRELEYQRRRSA